MEFTNSTPFPAAMDTGSTGEREMLCIIGSKITFAVQDECLVPVTGEQAWPVFQKPFVFGGVTLGPELDFRKQGIDLMVFGKAIPPGGEPVPSMLVEIECGSLNHSVAVFGDRKWEKNRNGLGITAPIPFTEMPLTNDRAFGGKALMNGEAMPHPINPDGRGFCASEEGVIGTDLPNLELPGALIRNWTDQPAPACLYKPPGPLGLKDLMEQDQQQAQADMMAALFNQSVPRLIAAAPEDLGKSIRLAGFSPEGALTLPVPDVYGPTAHVSVGALRSRFPSKISTLVVLAEARVLIASYICLFRYLFQPMEMRSVELRLDPGHTAAVV